MQKRLVSQTNYSILWLSSLFSLLYRDKFNLVLIVVLFFEIMSTAGKGSPSVLNVETPKRNFPVCTAAYAKCDLCFDLLA